MGTNNSSRTRGRRRRRRRRRRGGRLDYVCLHLLHTIVDPIVDNVDTTSLFNDWINLVYRVILELKVMF